MKKKNQTHKKIEKKRKIKCKIFDADINKNAVIDMNKKHPRRSYVNKNGGMKRRKTKHDSKTKETI